MDLSLLRIIFMVIFLCIGTIGNVLSIVTFTGKHSKKSSYTVFLTGLAIADLLMVYALIIRDLSKEIQAISLQLYDLGYCRLDLFLISLSSGVSVWMTVILALERTFCIYFPHKAKNVCKPKNAIILASPVVAFFSLYSSHYIYGFRMYLSDSVSPVGMRVGNDSGVIGSLKTNSDNLISFKGKESNNNKCTTFPSVDVVSRGRPDFTTEISANINEKQVGIQNVLNSGPVTCSSNQPIVTNDKPLTTKVINDKPLTTELTNDNPITREVTDGNPLTTEETHDKPLTIEVTNDKPQTTEVSNDNPITTEVSNGNQRTTQVTNGKPLSTEVTNDNSIISEVTNDKLLTIKATNDKAQTTEVTNDNPTTIEVSNGDPLRTEVTNDKQQTTEVTNDKLLTTEVTNDKLLTTEVTNDNPLTTEVTNDNPLTTEVSNGDPLTTEVTNDKPQTTEVSNGDPLTTEVSNDKQLTTEVTNDKLLTTEVTNDNPITTTVTNGNPITTEVTNDKPPTTEVTNDYQATDAAVGDLQPSLYPGKSNIDSTDNLVTFSNDTEHGMVVASCGFVDEAYANIFRRIVWVETFGLFALPVVILMVSNTATWIGVYRSSRRLSSGPSLLMLRRTRHVFVSTTLISVCFIVFLTPTVVVYVIDSLMTEEYQMPFSEETLALMAYIFKYVYLCNHSSNFFLYVLSGSRFRKDLKAALCK